MMKIQAMLNPSDAMTFSRESSPGASPVTQHRYFSPPRSTPKPEKAPKDGFANIKGQPRCTVRYPPHEIRQDFEIGLHLDKFQVRPDQTMGKFSEYPRYIPYTSAKKDFLDKTGLRGFNVFQYEFFVQDEANGKLKKHLVLWDYSVGMVRITPFFKALNYSKTTPKKVLDLNEGLADLTVSITGGSLAAQGYWMPFECAKAVALTFCYHIRHLLTPIFGREFLELCLPTNDPAYGTFKIEPLIVRACAEDMNTWRTRERCDTPQSTPSSPSQSPRAGYTTASAPSTPILHKSTRAQRPKLHRTHVSETGYGFEQDPATSSNNTSPQVSPRTLVGGSEWTSINRINPHATPEIGLPVKPIPSMRSPPSFECKPRELDIKDLLEETDAFCDELSRMPPPKMLCGTQKATARKHKPQKYHAQEYNAANILLQLSSDDKASKIAISDDTSVVQGQPCLDTAAACLDMVAERLESIVKQEDLDSATKKRDVTAAFSDTTDREDDCKKPSRRAST